MASSRRERERKTRSPLKVPDLAATEREQPQRSAVLAGVLLAAGILLFVFLLRFAVDILLWVLVLALLAIVLHYFTVWLAESELLSAPWLFIIVLTAGAATWMLWPGSSFQEGIDVTRFLPGPAVRALEWAEERSLTRRALASGPAPAGSPGRAAGSGAVIPPSAPVAAGGGVGSLGVSRSIVLTGAAASRVGEPVTLAATVRSADRSGTVGVQFFDGPVLLGEAVLQSVGNSARASFTATGLSVGVHRITARYAGATSAPLVHTVAGG